MDQCSLFSGALGTEIQACQMASGNKREVPKREKIVMRTLPLIAASIVLTALLGDPALGGREKQKPNIVFFLVDDLGWSDVGCYGSTFHETPHVDRLAKEGMRFDNAYSTCHVCSPSRASILTGKYPADRFDGMAWRAP